MQIMWMKIIRQQRTVIPRLLILQIDEIERLESDIINYIQPHVLKNTGHGAVFGGG